MSQTTSGSNPTTKAGGMPASGGPGGQATGPSVSQAPSQSARQPVGQSGGQAVRLSSGIRTGPIPITAPTVAPTVSGRLGEIRSSLKRAMAGTPGRLRILSLVGVAVSLIFAISAFSTFGSTNDALRRAEDNTSQLVRIQAIHTNLVRADADATNAFLVGGLEPADQRNDYTSSIAQASRLIAEAAKSQPADGPALGALNSSLVTYASLIEQARATNRQGLPLGAQYLRVADSGLRSDALPVVDALVKANEARVTVEFDGVSTSSIILIAGGALAVIALATSMVWLARRTHRYVNPPMAAATAAVLVTLVAGAFALGAVSSRVDDVRSGSYAATLATAKARIAAFDAKANESLTLISRGSGSNFENAWQASSKIVTDQSSVSSRLTEGEGAENLDAARMSGLWASYINAHKAIRTADDGGQWESAVSQAIGKGSKSANAVFDTFDAGSATVLTKSSGAVIDSLDAPRTWLPLAGWLGLLIGIAAALSAWWGVSLRLEEYR